MKKLQFIFGKLSIHNYILFLLVTCVLCKYGSIRQLKFAFLALGILLVLSLCIWIGCLIAEKENPLKHVEDTIEQNDNNFDGIINNTPQTPTVDALEQKAKAGEVISLVDLADAIKADKEQGKTAKPEKKPSIRAQLKADKEKAQKKPQKSKSQDLERS